MGLMQEKIKANAKKTTEPPTTNPETPAPKWAPGQFNHGGYLPAMTITPESELPTMTESTVLELTDLATAIIDADLAERVEDAVNPVHAFHKALMAAEVISLNHMKATSRSISKTPEEWALAIGMLNELVENPIIRREEPAMAAAARRLTKLHYPRGATEFVRNINALHHKLVHLMDGIVTSGKPVPETLVIHWDCDPKNKYFDNNKAEYQLVMKLNDRYDYYSAKIDNGATNARPDSPAGAEARAEDRAAEREDHWDHMHTSKLDGSLLDERI